MSTDTTTHRTSDQDLLGSPSSDEKMDTGSESVPSTEDTPSSVVSSDFEDKDQGSTENCVLRLQNPETDEPPVLRLSDPVTDSIINKRLTNVSLNDSLVTRMSNLKLNSPETDELLRNSKDRPRNLGVSPPKLSLPLTLTTDHPLMGLGSPDSVENYPDVVPKKDLKKIEDETKDLSLSSIEDERATNEGNSFSDFDGPQRNTSKNNLYFHENFTTADSQILNDISRIDGVTTPPDVARIEKLDVKRIATQPYENSLSPQRVFTRIIDGSGGESAILKYAADRSKKQSMGRESTPIRVDRTSSAVNVSENGEFHSGVGVWCESPPHQRSMPNFQLPIEMSTNIGVGHHELESPDVVSASTQEDKSAYQALLDPHTGSVVLRHASACCVTNTSDARRRITVPPQDDSSVDTLSECSLESEGEEDPPAEHPAPAHTPPGAGDCSVYDDALRNSVCESDPISEYSAAEELEEERAWLRVPLSSGGHRACDKKVIEPYMRVLSHGGYVRAGGSAIIVLSACHLPDCARADYHYVMDNLFLYVLWSLERLVSDSYVLVYLHGSAARRRLPTWRWLHQWYMLVDRRLKKSLQQLYLVHPTFWLKSMVIISKPFISSKFSRKLCYVKNLTELMEKVPVDPNAIPELVKQYDEQLK